MTKKTDIEFTIITMKTDGYSLVGYREKGRGVARG